MPPDRRGSGRRAAVVRPAGAPAPRSVIKRHRAQIGWTTTEGAASVNDLIDTTEMYLRTIYELEEEGVPPMRARIAERLGQSGPTVSQTVARMHRAGLVDLGEGNRLVLTEVGHATAMRVMRKHRLAECLLIQVIGLDWEHVHEEACRWEHVMSEAVERRLLEVLDHPTHSPYGNPIPGLEELGDADPHEGFLDGLVPLPSAALPDEDS